ncbi:uncharacterized protein LOC116304286 [Actinia tenebrosa]|uniref:Uncharacterized protein LOC116304286 n=1 Tax=Actinia tenebrosa TaxID=6105 RepID=A0A6P8ISI9_ACTTE|nr:uncharacterized protein LOC116304286 [Actinia tenebrosa]XP_031569852.1 uncharacterized protein LOC116304286 [Actinia tenebrosa]XP_031569853.1 uncharacterized protein LOC116304286 [Actinia tenebrosa]
MPRQFVRIAMMALLVSNCLSHPFRDLSAIKSKLEKRLLAEILKGPEDAKHVTESREVGQEEIDLEGECHDVADQHKCMFVMLNIHTCDAYYKKNCALSCGECYYKKK